MFEDVLIMLSTNTNKVKSFTDILKRKKISFKMETFDDGRNIQKCVYVSFWQQHRAMKLFKNFKENYKN